MRVADFFLLPNLCSLSRIFLTPVLACFLASENPHATWWAVAVLIVAGITDWLDGYLARRSGMITPLGIALDPVADKIFAAVTIILLICFREFPVWLAVGILGRDLLILIVASLLIKDKHITLPSNLTGKYAFASIAVLIGCYLLRWPVGEFWMTWIVIILLAASLINYTHVAIAIRRGKEIPHFQDNWIKRVLRYGALLFILIWLGHELWLFYRSGGLPM